MDIFKKQIFGLERINDIIVIYRYGELPVIISLHDVTWHLVPANHEHDEEFIIIEEKLSEEQSIFRIYGYSFELEAFADKIGITTGIFPT